MEKRNENETNKIIAVIAVLSGLIFFFLPIMKKVEDFSMILGVIFGFVAIAIIGIIMKTIWPDLW